MNTEEMVEPIKSYNDTKQNSRTISVSYRCAKCGVVWTRLKDAKAHTKTCNKGETK